MAKMFIDEDSINSAAAGIRLLINTIANEETTESVRSLAADCIARLAHSRIGLSAQYVFIIYTMSYFDALYVPSTTLKCV